MAWNAYTKLMLEGGCEYAAVWGCDPVGPWTTSDNALSLDFTEQEIKELSKFLCCQKDEPCPSGKSCYFGAHKCMHIRTLYEGGTTTCIFKEISSGSEKVCVAVSFLEGTRGLLIGAAKTANDDKKVANAVDYYGRYINGQQCASQQSL